ncbi:hypothetical protein Tco_1347996, partial [Tanacetum coccineum]
MVAMVVSCKLKKQFQLFKNDPKLSIVDVMGESGWKWPQE